jgi:polar amino acid transport system substrate-binding protein
MQSVWLRAAVLLPLVCWSATPAPAQTLEQIKATGTLTIGYVEDQAPFTSAEGDGAPAGYAIDICAEVTQEVNRHIPGIKVEYVKTTMADAFQAVADGHIDLLCGAVSATLERRETVDFSEPIFVTGVSGLMRRDSPRDLRELFMGVLEISSPRSPELRPFARENVGVRAGTSTEEDLREAVRKGGYQVTIVSFATHESGLAALEARQIDGYFADRALLDALLMKAARPSELIVGTRLFTREHYALAMRRGDADFRLLVDRALTRFYAEPAFTALLARYFGGDVDGLKSSIVAEAIPE